MKRVGPLSVTVAVGLASAPARAASCQEILKMVEQQFPVGMIESTLRADPDGVDVDTVRCLEERRAPVAITAVARELAGVPVTQAQPPVVPVLSSCPDILAAVTRHGAAAVAAGIRSQPDGQLPDTVFCLVQMAAPADVLAAARERARGGSPGAGVDGEGPWGHAAPVLPSSEPAPPEVGAGGETAGPTEPAAPRRRELGRERALRVSVGALGALYSYQQDPLVERGGLYRSRVTVGGGAGAPAAAAGFQVEARAFPSEWTHLGLTGSFRSARWSMLLPQAFDEPVSDWLNELAVRGVLRLPVALSTGRAHVGLRAGLDVDDFLSFTMSDSETEGVSDVFYGQLVVAAGGVGGEVAFEGESLFLVGSYDLAFTSVEEPYSMRLRGQAGYSLSERWFVQIDGAWRERRAPVYAGDDKGLVGVLKDSMLSGGLQGGVHW